MNYKNISHLRNVIMFEKYHFEKSVFVKIRTCIYDGSYQKSLKILTAAQSKFHPMSELRIKLLKVYLYLSSQQLTNAKKIMEEKDMMYLFKYTDLLLNEKLDYIKDLVGHNEKRMKQLLSNFSYNYEYLLMVLENTFIPMYNPFISEFTNMTIWHYFKAKAEEEMNQRLAYLAEKIILRNSTYPQDQLPLPFLN